MFKRLFLWFGGLSRLWRWLLIVILVLIVVALLFWPKGNGLGETVRVSRGEVAQEVRVVGTVKAAGAVDLAFNSSGLVGRVNKRVGEVLGSGEIVASLENSELAARLSQQETAVERARVALASLIEPPTDLERLEAENEVQQATVDLKQMEDDAFVVLAEAYVDLETIISDLDDILSHDHLSSSDIKAFGSFTEGYRDRASDAYYDANVALRKGNKDYRALSREASRAEISQSLTQAEVVALETAEAVKLLRVVVLRVKDDLGNQVTSQITTDLAILDTHAKTITAQVAALSAALDDIVLAEQSLRKAIAAKQDLLDGPDANDVRREEIAVREAELAAESVRAQIRQRLIIAPFAGKVARLDLEVGEAVGGGEAVVSIISVGQYEVEANVPEIDIAKVALGASTEITLDAYPPDETFSATVIAIDPAETVVEGVATYKVTLVLDDSDERILPGMTANLMIGGERRQEVLRVPVRALKQEAGQQWVRVLVGGKAIERRPVTVGLRGSGGLVEIISGLSEGEEVLIN